VNGRLKPLKRFGQNYLTDKNTINKIVNEFNPAKEDIVLEIGPGTGSLTSLLFDKVKKYTAVEIDTRVIDELKTKFPSVEIINNDILDIDLKEISSQKFRVIGNIPYNITSPIIFKLIENRTIVSDAMLMVQYEVAKRITAQRGTKDYGILGVLVNYFAETELCFKISPNVFYPKPKVFSAIIRLKFRELEDGLVEDKLLIQTVKAAFGNRRKTLKNSLRNSIFAEVNFDSLSYLLTKRAEELSIQEFIKLTDLIKEQLDGRRNQKS
jgi:16S rRNA (adenine1518-N6/adenine1519-N6)-dimethyltransferase